MSTKISNYARDPFWRDFTDIPFYEDVYSFQTEDNESGFDEGESLVIEREGTEIRICMSDNQIFMDGFVEFNRLAFCLKEAQKRIRDIRQDMQRYWRETDAAELKRKIARAPSAADASVKSLQAAADETARARRLLQDGNYEEAAKALTEAASLTRDGLSSSDALRRVVTQVVLQRSAANEQLSLSDVVPPLPTA